MLDAKRLIEANDIFAQRAFIDSSDDSIRNALRPSIAERTVEGLWDAIGRLFDLITPAESANFFTAAGHEPE